MAATILNKITFLRLSTLLAWVILVFLPAIAGAAGAGITYHGRLVDKDGRPVESSNVQFKLQIRTPGNENCLMYEEVQVKDLSQTSGAFAVTINDGTGTRLDSSGYTLDQIFANRNAYTFAGATCSAGTSYTPNPTDSRRIQVLFNDGTFPIGQWEPVPPMAVNFVPMAIESMQVGGYKKEQLLKIADGVTTTGTELNLASWTELLALIGGTSTQFIKPNNANFTAAPTWSGTPTTANDLTNKTYVDAQVAAASLPNVGTAGTYTKVTTDAKGRVTAGATLAEADIPNLTTAGKVDGGAINAGTIGGSAAINTTGNLYTTGTVTGLTVSSTNLRVYNGNDYVQFSAPALGGANVLFKLPAADGSAGQVLKTDGAGNLSWLSPSTGSVTGSGTTNYLPMFTAASVLGNSPLAVSSGNVGVGTAAPNTALDINGALSVRGMAAPAVSVAGQGRMYFDSTSNTFKMSKNNGAYGDVAFGNCALNEVLKWDGTTWGCATDATGTAPVDSSYAAKGIVQFLTDAATSGITVASGVANVNTGTGANQIVKLTAASKYPAVDGSLITNIAAGNITGVLPIANGGTNSSTALNSNRLMASVGGAIVETAAMTDGQFVVGKTGEAPQLVTMSGDATVSNTGTLTLATVPVTKGGTATTSYGNNKVIVSNGTGSALVGASCALNQVISFDAGGSLACANVSDLSSAFQNGGNSFGANATLGTNDNYTLGFETNNSVAMTILANGNVGVGTAAPDSKLDVKGTFRISGATSGAVEFAVPVAAGSATYTWPAAVPASNKVLQSDNAGALSWVTVGVGDALTTNPLSQFAATTSAQLAGVLSDETGTGVAVFGTSPTFTTSILSPMIVGGTGATSSLTYKTTTGVGTTGADHVFQVGNNGATEAMRILNDGNVGIGTAVPEFPLHVTTSGSLTGGFVSTSALSATSGAGMIGYAYNTPTAADQRLGYFLTGSKGGGTNLYHGAGMVGFSEGTWNPGVSHPTYFTFETTPSASTTRSERMRITSTGNVGIGTNAPNTKLDLSGALSIRGMAAPAVSVAGQGRMYFDSTSNTFKLSKNNGSYGDIAFGNCALNEVLKWNGTTWACATDATGSAPADSSYGAKGIVQFLTDAATSGITVASGVANVNMGTGANQVVQLTAASKYPAVDGSLITNIAAGNITGVLPIANGGTNSSTALNSDRLMASVGGAIVEMAAMTDGQIVVGKTGAAPQLVTMSGDATVSNLGAVTLATVPVTKGGTATTSYGNNKVIVSNGTGSALVGASCALNQVISFDAGGSLTCADISDLSTAYQNGGNSFGANATLGTNDNYTLAFKTNNAVVMTILANGNVGIGATNPGSSLEINRAISSIKSSDVATGAGNTLNILGSASGDNNGGNINITAGATNATFAGTSGGSVNITSGSNAGGTVATSAGNVTIKAANAVGGSSANGGSLTLAAGNSAATGSAKNPGNVTITAGNSGSNLNAGSNAAGGGVTITAGSGNSNASAAADSAGDGGPISITSGSGGGGGDSANGGNITMQTGAAGGAGLIGAILFKIGGNFEKMRIHTNGNVGIGTAAPTAKLHVSGGAIVAAPGSGSAQCTDFSTGNIQVSSYVATNTIKIGGLVDGGAYTLVLTGYTGGQTITVEGYTDETCTAAVTTGVDFGGSAGAVTPTFVAAGNTQLVTFIYSAARGVVYASAGTNFYH